MKDGKSLSLFYLYLIQASGLDPCLDLATLISYKQRKAQKSSLQARGTGT